MLVSRQLGEEIDRLLSQMQAELAAETDQILKGLGNVVPTDKEAKALIKGEDINTTLTHEIKIWRRYYG